MIQHNGPISGVASSANYIATAGYDNLVILWDARSKKALARGHHDHLANRCEISSDEKYLVSASSDYTARVWKLPEMQLMSVLGGHSDDVEMARFSPCGSMVATTCQDGKVRIFSKSGVLIKTFSGHEGLTSSCVWSADGKFLISTGDDGTIRTWNTETGVLEKNIKPENVQTDTLAIGSSGVIYAGNDSGELVRIAGDDVQTLKVHSAGIKNLCISLDETYIATLSYDGNLALIKIEDGLKLERRIKFPSLIWARSCAFKDKENLIFGTFGSSYATLNLATEHWDLSQVHSTDCINALLVSKDSVYTVGDSGEVKRVSFINDKFTQHEPIAKMGSLCNFITRFKDRIVCGGHMGKVFNAITGAEILSLKAPINKGIQVGEYLVLALYTGELAVAKESNCGRLELVGEYRILQNAVKDIAADGMTVFCAGAACDIALFDLRKMELVRLPLQQAHNSIVNSCTYLGKGRFATVSRDLNLKIWEDLQLVGSYKTPHNHSVKCVSASRDGRYIAAGSYDGKIAIFNLENKTWSVYKKLTTAGISSITFAQNSFWASAYDGQIFKVGYP